MQARMRAPPASRTAGAGRRELEGAWAIVLGQWPQWVLARPAAAFAVMTAGTVATSMVDFYKARRAAVRKHAVSYLIGLEDP